MPLNYINKSDESNLQLINEYFSDKELNYINLYEALKKEKSALPNESDITIYHKKDTHWNNYGAKIAYNELMQEVKKQLPDYYYNDYSNLNFIKKSDWNVITSYSIHYTKLYEMLVYLSLVYLMP